MRDPSGNGLTFEVVTEELRSAASAVDVVTETAVEGVLESLPSLSATMGHPRLQETVVDFCARWDTGLSHLVGDSRGMSERLRSCADAYAGNDATTRATYERLREGWAPSPTRPPWWATLGGVAANPLTSQ